MSIPGNASPWASFFGEPLPTERQTAEMGRQEKSAQYPANDRFAHVNCPLSMDFEGRLTANYRQNSNESLALRDRYKSVDSARLDSINF